MTTTKKESHLTKDELEHYSISIETLIEDVGTVGLDEILEVLGHRSTRQLDEEKKMLLETLKYSYGILTKYGKPNPATMEKMKAAIAKAENK